MAELETKDTKRTTQIKTNIVTGKNITFLLYLLSLNWTNCEKANFPLEAKQCEHGAKTVTQSMKA